MQTQKPLSGGNPRSKRMRLDTASVLKRFFFVEQSLVVSQSAWLAKIGQFDVKTLLPKMAWEDALTANALRERVFELHYPSRLMNIGDDTGLMSLVSQAINAPSPEALILSLAEVFKPALLKAYQRYLDEADDIADGPTLRFIRAAIEDKEAQIDLLKQFTENMAAEADSLTLKTAKAWLEALRVRWEQIGGITLEEAIPPIDTSTLSHSTPFALPNAPARDLRFVQCQFYWPDVIVPNYPYGEGMSLQLRSAVSHINEVWAVDAAGAAIYGFAELLGWEFIYQGARWCYDESRHARMGYDRLMKWGFKPSEIPLGTYIYDSASGKDVLYLMGMLAYFETKNIGKKSVRARAFSEMNDATSQHDMEFDWADETIHANYGAHWLTRISELRPDLPEYNLLKEQCNALVSNVIASATDSQRMAITAIAETLLRRAEALTLSVPT